jgi:VIT1/CCC1 family predicted Fe2+/Mn2+ transporter
MEEPIMAVAHTEKHKLASVGWLRAAVLGANDGIVTMASLILGVAASRAGRHEIVVAAVAALVAGAMSMAAGEYVSVQSQADAEGAALDKERAELASNPAGERRELAAIYVRRGLAPGLADEVARQLMAHDALSAHTRDELGITEALMARPVQAALASALSFAAGGVLPLAVALFAPAQRLVVLVAVASLACLALLGGLAAQAGGASVPRGVVRVTFWSLLAMAVTGAIGKLFGAGA